MLVEDRNNNYARVMGQQCVYIVALRNLDNWMISLQLQFGIVNKCNEVLVVTGSKISVLETYWDVRYAYKILEREQERSGHRQLGREREREREVDEANIVG